MSIATQFDNVIEYISEKLQHADDGMPHHYAVICKTGAMEKKCFEKGGSWNK